MTAAQKQERMEVARRYGEHLAATRAALRVTHADIAKAIGVVPAAVSAWECGRSLPTFYTSLLVRDFLKARAKQLGVKLVRQQFDLRIGIPKVVRL